MVTECKKIEIMTVALEARPGSLGQVLSAFQEGKVNVLSSFAHELGLDKAEVMLCASDWQKAKDIVGKVGKEYKMSYACWADGADQIGVYAELLKKIAKANVNLVATGAMSWGGKFGTVFFAQENDVANLCRALGC